MSTIKNDVISARSALNKKDYAKRNRKPSKNSSSALYADSMAKLRAALVVIPVVMVLIISAVLFFGIQYLTSVSGGSTHQQKEAAATALYSAADSEKLLTIVSPQNPLPSDYKLNLVTYGNIKIDSIVKDGIESLVNAASNDGIKLDILKGYVSTQEQNELYNAEVHRLTDSEGYSRAKAEEEAEKTVPMGNHADQQTGLSVEFASSAAENFAESEEFYWLMKNAYKYGFVLRYPENKEDDTDMPFNPSLFRYVGNENASKMVTLNRCLDEYVTYLSAR